MDFSPYKTMRYVLYDLRKDPDTKSALANVHLPIAMDDGPVLFRVESEQYRDVVYSLREMCVNEGDEWLTTMLIRSPHSLTGDLEPNAVYILVAHVELFQADPEGFMNKLPLMKRMIFH